jgi:hypothetical protein
MNVRPRFRFVLAAVTLWGLALSQAAATRHPHAPMPPQYPAECGSCHLPYAAEFLSAEAWKTLMASLDKHFDVDAEIDPAHHKPILNYLIKHAGHKANFDPGPAKLKIVETRWFRQTHADTARGHWPKHKNKANCQACHPKADQDDFVSLSDPNF